MAHKAVSMSSRKPRTYKDGRQDIDWNNVILKAQEIVESYATSVTLRQLYYKLVSLGLIPNDQNMYKNLSRKTAAARREGWFPTLIDRTREIDLYATWATPAEALDQMVDTYRRDRTEGQPKSIYIGVEKHGMTVQLMSWFGDMGIPVLALGGYSSQTFVDEVKQHVEAQGRESILLYAGDFDASGVDIDRDFVERTEIFDAVKRVALNKAHLKRYNLPPMPGKPKDARSASFKAKHGELIQVELDALDPADLRKLFQKEIDKHWDTKAFKKIQRTEEEERGELHLIRELQGKTSMNIIAEKILDLDGDEISALNDAIIDRRVELGM